VRAGSIEAERLTPTGAAILTTVADGWAQMPVLRPLAVGYGAGDREFEGSSNALRMILGESIGDAPRVEGDSGAVVVIECTVDDSTPQALAYAAACLLESGALEVFTTPVTMKKARAGHQLTVLGRPEDLHRLAEILLRETSTLGLRFRRENRIELERVVHRVQTAYGTVGVKAGWLGGRELQAWPEYEDCASLAERHGVALWDVQRAALDAHHEKTSRQRARAKRKTRAGSTKDLE
jgi:uncharacterized protein (DUF111 family)